MERERLLEHIHYIQQQLQHEKALVAKLEGDLQSIGTELERTKSEAQTWKDVVEARSDCVWTPHTTEKLSSNLEDYANHPEYRDAFRRANLGTHLNLEKANRDKVSICALLYDRLDVNYEQLCTISRATVPPDPRTFLYIFQRHLADIASKRPMFQASMMSFPEGTPPHVIDQALSAHSVATQIAYRGDPWQKNPTRFQFKVKDMDKAIVLLGSLNGSLSVNTLKRQVAFVRKLLVVRSPGIPTALPTISEDVDDDEGVILDDNETFAAPTDGSVLSDATTAAPVPAHDELAHAGDSMCAKRHRAGIRLDQDGGCDVSSIGNSTGLGEEFVSDEGSTFESDNANDSCLPRNVIVADNGEDDDVSTIGARESFVPTDIERRRYIIADRVEDEVAELSPSDRVLAKRVILEASASLPSDETSQGLHIARNLVKALPNLPESLLYGKAAS